MVDGDSNQASAAELGFRSAAPGAAYAALIDLLQFVFCVDPHPLKNGEPFAFGIMGVLRVMTNLAGGRLMKHSAKRVTS